MKRLAIASLLLIAVAGPALAGDRIAGREVYQARGCAACHGADGVSVTDPSYPILAGQHADYLEQSLRSYRRGAQGAPDTANVRRNAIMGAFASSMSDQEIRDVSAFLASLQGGGLSTAR